MDRIFSNITEDEYERSQLSTLILDEIRDLFYSYFDHPWLINIIFGISPFVTKKQLSNKNIRKCTAYTLPFNTNNLSRLIADLEKEILKESLMVN